MVVLLDPRLSKSNIKKSDNVHYPEITLDYIQTLAQLVGYNEATKTTDLLKLDGEGNLLVSSEGTAGEDIYPSSATVTSSATLIVASRADRKSLTLKNLSGVSIYISSSDTVTTGNGYILSDGTSITFDNFIGAIYGIATSGSNDISVLEVV